MAIQAKQQPKHPAKKIPNRQTTTKTQNNGQVEAKNNKTEHQRRRSTKTQKLKLCFCPKNEKGCYQLCYEIAKENHKQINHSSDWMQPQKKKKQAAPFSTLHQTPYQQHYFASSHQPTPMYSWSPRRTACQSQRKHQNSPPQNRQRGLTKLWTKFNRT